MKNSFKVVVFISLLVISNLALSSTQEGTIDWIDIRENGVVHFSLIGTRTTVVGTCAEANPHFWVIKDENSQAGKYQMSVILAAKLSQNIISITGTGLCTRITDGEDVRNLLIN